MVSGPTIFGMHITMPEAGRRAKSRARSRRLLAITPDDCGRRLFSRGGRSRQKKRLNGQKRHREPEQKQKSPPSKYDETLHEYHEPNCGWNVLVGSPMRGDRYEQGDSGDERRKRHFCKKQNPNRSLPMCGAAGKRSHAHILPVHQPIGLDLADDASCGACVGCALADPSGHSCAFPVFDQAI